MKPTSNIEIVPGNWQQDPEPMRQVRFKVFVEEQAVPIELEWDEEDASAHHFVAYEGDTPIGTARLLPNGQIGRMAVLKEYRGHNIGSALLQNCEQKALRSGLNKTKLSAQEHAIEFYQRHGYAIISDTYMDAGIPHKSMEKSLQTAPTDQDMQNTNESQTFICHDIRELRNHCLEITRQSKRHICIFSQALEAELYNTKNFSEALLRMVKLYRYNYVRVLTIEYRKAEQEGHELANLARRFPSLFTINQVSKEYTNSSDSFLLADDRSYIYRKFPATSRSTEVFAEINYDAPHKAKKYRDVFDEMWDHSSTIKAFRPLVL